MGKEQIIKTKEYTIDEPCFGVLAESPDYNPDLLGVLEWIVSVGGSVKVFTEGLLYGQVKNICYRYFPYEGWIGLHGLPRKDGKVPAFYSLDDFQQAIRDKLERTKNG